MTGPEYEKLFELVREYSDARTDPSRDADFSPVERFVNLLLADRVRDSASVLEQVREIVDRVWGRAARPALAALDDRNRLELENHDLMRRLHQREAAAARRNVSLPRLREWIRRRDRSSKPSALEALGYAKALCAILESGEV